MAIDDSLDDLICNLKQNMSDTFVKIVDLQETLEGYAQNPHQHQIQDVINLQNILDGKANNTLVTTNTNGLMSAADKTKLNNIEAGANKIIIDSALSSSSTNPIQNKVINTALGNKVDKVSGKALSSNDFTSALKTKLDGIETQANKTIVDSYLSLSSANPVQNKVVANALSTKASTNVATTSANGLMSAADKVKLNSVNTAIDASLSTTSTNPVQNKIITNALNGKASTSVASTSANGLMSAADKTKLNNIAEGATKNKRVLGLLLTCPNDSNNAGLITIKKGTDLKFQIYESASGDWRSDAYFPPNMKIGFVLNNTVYSRTNGSTMTINLSPGLYPLYVYCHGSGNFCPVYRTVILKVIN